MKTPIVGFSALFIALPVLSFAAEPVEKTTLTYPELTALIRKNSVRSVDALLPLLPRGYRKNYTFVYESRALNASAITPDEPRAILYGSDAKLIMSFTKSGKEKFRNMLEVISFDETKRAYEFRVIRFEKGKDPLRQPPEVNPKVCTTCHGADPRPLFDAYNLWPGVYGSVSRRGCDSTTLGTLEHKYYLSFLEKNRKKDRYQHLPRALPVLPSDDPLLKDCNHVAEAGQITVANGADHDGNATLSQILYEQNILRMTRILESAPNFGKFKYAFAAYNKHCVRENDFETLFPENYAETRGVRKYDQVYEDVTRLGKEDFSRLVERFNRTNSGSPNDEGRRPLDFGEFLSSYSSISDVVFFFERLGIPFEGLSNVFTDGVYNFGNPGGDQITDILFNVKSNDEIDPALSCDELREKSREAIASE